MNPPIRAQVNKHPIIPLLVAHPAEGDEDVTLDVIPLRIHVGAALLNHDATILGSRVVAIPLSIEAERAREALDGIVPQEGVLDDSVAIASLDDGASEIGDDDNPVVT